MTNVLLVIMATLGRLGDDASPVPVITTLIWQTPNPVIDAQADAFSASTTQRETSVNTAKGVTMVMPLDVPAAVVLVIIWVQSEANAPQRSSANVIGTVGSASAYPVFKDRTVTVVPPTSGT